MNSIQSNFEYWSEHTAQLEQQNQRQLIHIFNQIVTN